MPEPGVRPARQQRSRESQERVLQAAEALLAEKGYEGFTMTEVAGRAGISVGSVYGRFEGREALIYAVHARVNARLSAIDVDLSDAPDLASALTQTVQPGPLGTRWSAEIRTLVACDSGVNTLFGCRSLRTSGCGSSECVSFGFARMNVGRLA